jgi:hypothetical protein
MKKILGYGISIPVLLFGALGNFHLYKEAGGISLRNLIVGITATGVELSILFLIHSLASSKLKESVVNLVTGWLLAIVIPVSLLGQYSYLLKEASKKTEAVLIAKQGVDTLGTEKASLIASKVPLQDERKVLVATLEKESSSGYGPKAKAIKSEIEGLDSKLAAIDSKIEGLGTKVETKQVESLEVTELSVLAKEFGLDANGFMKIMVGIFLTIANALGFWLVYLADVGKSERVNMVVNVRAKAKAKTKGMKMTREKEQPVERVILTKDELPANVVKFPSDMVS